jgi:metallo-beta-lactamase family protein
MHPDQEGMAQALVDVVNSTREAGGNLVIPAFAIERTQELLYYFDQLLLADRIPHLVVFVDSPMAADVTDVFKHHPELFDAETLALIHSHKSPFDFPGLHLVRTIDESKAINHISGTVAVIAGSGMCTGGRIKHHLITNIVRPESTILFVGYQAANTLGRQIVDGAREVRILGQTYPVRARIAQMNGFSAHADRDELLRWLRNLEGPPRHVFITHGEPEVSQHFDALVRERFGWDCSVPEYRDAVTLS